MGNESSKTKPGKTINSLGLRVGPSQSTIQRHVDNARKSRILQLKSCGLKSIPHALNELQDIIRSLELSQNKIKEIPSSIGQFSALKQLHLSENIISVLPDEIGQLNSLEILNLQSNKLSTLPETIVGCTALKTINISANSFSQFPIAVCYLTSLDTLNLAQNTITALPDEVIPFSF
ncbi:leucine Rich repeat-containing domain protein [Dictyocaulus viviparus]|uniref:Leucine Rich repeat-containing domain protein n=1 Tax=Dictyocaulus viviparus TaxID=29172 RepID=A0A0D8XKY0_DICVI|nr:leucine Rich repeat-containing domain protein [Dictyocaulus viviparus]